MYKRQDKRESIPFLGEIPGFGKLFSTTSSSQTNSEMFIFITPRIVPDSLEQADQLRMQDLLKRPGDVPEFLDIVQKAKEKERQKLFTGTLKTLFASNASAFKHRGHYG